MTELEPQDDTSEESESGLASANNLLHGLTSSHRRPLPNPGADARLLIGPPKLAPARSHLLTEKQELAPAKHKDRPASSKERVLPERVAFPVATSPPRATQIRRIGSAEATGVEAEKSATVPSMPESVGAEAAQRSPLFGLVFYVALSFGTLSLGDEVRYLVLWIVLLVLGIAFLNLNAEGTPVLLESVNIVWGAGTGFVVSFPLFLLATKGLAQTSRAFVPFDSNAALFQALAFTWPLGESLYYRGAVQREHGLVAASLAAAGGSLLLYWPLAQGIFSVLFAAVLFASVLAFVYGYVRMRYGLMASFVSQVVANLMLLFLPRLLIAA